MTAATGTAAHAALMDRVYRHQRHIYDATRKYYLLGRDPMLEGLKPPAAGHMLEIGCGTGRNLIEAARLYPTCRLYGMDISAAMMETAGQSVHRAGLRDRVRMAQGDATAFDPAAIFGRAGFDRIYISYAVSMIPAWQAVIEEAVECLAPRGELHIVDFGDLAGLPSIARSALYEWLRWHHVAPRNDLFTVMHEAARSRGRSFGTRVLHRGFAWIGVIGA
jgi:S-adenosylmethionine-diacylgycerolhomoserine-N-methlytransferase